MDRFFTLCASRIATAAGQPLTFVVALTVILWAVWGPVFHYSDTWQLIINTGTTMVTFLAVFLIQNSQNRDAAAIQAKLDEMIRAIEAAREEFIGIEHLTEADRGNPGAAGARGGRSRARPARSTKRRPVAAADVDSVSLTLKHRSA